MKKKDPITAGELINRLNSDPEYVARRREQERILDKRRAEFKAEQVQLIADLGAVGVKVESVWDLVNSSQRYDQAIPVLVKHLHRPYSEKLREGIARALAIPSAKCVWEVLVEEYRKSPDLKSRSGVKDGLAVALAATVTENTLKELIELAMDKSNGSSRLLLLRPLRRRRSKNQSAQRAIAELASDPDLAKEIAAWK